MQRVKKWVVIGLLSGMCGQALADSAPDFTQLIKETKDAVVSIDTEITVTSRSRDFSRNFQDIPGFPGLPDIFEHFFDIPQPGAPRDPNPQKRRQAKGSGSGFIVEKDGYLLTNAHVIDEAERIKVRLSNGKEYEAKLIGSDKRTDIALLKIDADDDLPVVKLGDSDKVQVGDWVYAIGSPFGLDYTATKGIVSAVARNLRDEYYIPFIQTDAAVNPGNSGGPLFNAQGKVVGITSMIYSRTGTFNGLAFCIPVNMVKDIIAQLKKDGKVSRGLIGVYVQEIAPELAKSFGMDSPHGALVSKVVPESAAEKAGMKIGDVILSLNGKKVESDKRLPAMVGSLPVNKPAEIVVLRDGKEITLSITPIYDSRDSVADASANRWGLGLQEITDEHRQALRLDPDLKGVLVAEVAPSSPADYAGIQSGDVLLAIGNISIDNLTQAAQILREADNKQTMALLIHRRGYNRYVALSAKNK